MNHRPTTDLKIRGLDEEVVVRLDRFARQAKQSRENYLRQVLTHLSVHSEVLNQQKMYDEVLRINTQIIQENNQLMQVLIERLEETNEWKK